MQKMWVQFMLLSTSYILTVVICRRAKEVSMGENSHKNHKERTSKGRRSYSSSSPLIDEKVLLLLFTC
jgi:membrane protein implicated in regulation of membrane protease activity